MALILQNSLRRNIATAPSNGDGAPHLMNSIILRNPAKLMRTLRFRSRRGSKRYLIRQARVHKIKHQLAGRHLHSHSHRASDLHLIFHRTRISQANVLHCPTVSNHISDIRENNRKRRVVERSRIR
ncbi:hypothetical protein M5K25_012609 [Dendrobium thyrsiflorum]|uniref:Uncharacterized protein n=1 Tax=Dendrobium thyrsiflorum TaxID=117978 RepID=A0ABD0UYG2_DENTH